MPRLIDRRTLLKGAGVSLAIPWLECMGAASKGDTKDSARRLACVFFPNGVSLPPEDHPHHKDWYWFPQGEGADYRFTRTLSPLEPFRNDLTVMAGLSHPAGRSMPPHSQSDIFLTSLTHGSSYANSISIDQVAAQHFGSKTRLDSLVLSTTGGTGQAGRTHTLSYTPNGQPIPAEDNLRRAFNGMFGQSAESAKSTREALARKKSMLDYVLDSAHSLSRNLGKADKDKLDEYLTSVRALERRVERTEHYLDIPKAKVDPSELMIDAGRDTPLDYIRAMYDLIFLAFQTDTTRVASYLMGSEASLVLSDSFPKALGLGLHHAMSHDYNNTEDGFKDWARWDQFVAEQLAYFLGRLKNTQEGDSTLLDRTIIFQGSASSLTHVAKNYPLILAGGRELGLKHGRYIKFVEKDTRLAELFLTMLHRLDIPVQSFADGHRELSVLVS